MTSPKSDYDQDFIRHRRTAHVRRWDWFKFLVALVLILLLVNLLFVQNQRRSETSVAGVNDIPATEPTAVFEPTPVRVTIDRPAGPQLATVALTNPAANADVAVGTVSLAGTGSPNSRVIIYRNGAAIATADVDANGRWSKDVAFNDAGAFAMTFAALTADGVKDNESAATTLNVVAPTAAAQPAAPTISAPVDAFLPGGPYTLSGAGTPGSTVTVVVDGAVIGEATVNTDGAWSLPLTLDAPGRRHIQAQTGGGSAEREYTVFDVFGFETTQLSSGRYIMRGPGAVGARVDVIINGAVVDTLTVGANGRWSYPLDLARPGDYLLGARLYTADGVTLSDAEAFPLSLAAQTGQLQVAFGAGVEQADGALLVTSPAVALILDASWSMEQPLGDTSRIDVARTVLVDLINNTLPPSTPIALRAFGNLEGDLSCRTDLMMRLQPLDPAVMTERVLSVEPKFNANTPLAASLSQVVNDLANASGPKIIVLLTDGEETCGGDPEAAIRRLSALGIDVQVNIVGLSIDDDALKDQFEQWARAGNGRYFDANSAEELAASLAETLLVQYQVFDAAGQEVTRGAVGQPAFNLPAGNYTVQLRTPGAPTYDVTVSADETAVLTIE